MRKLDDPDNKIIDTIVTPTISGVVFGQKEGFMITTFFSESRDTLIDKASILGGWEKMKSGSELHYLNDNHDTDVPPIGYIRSAYLVENGDFLGIYAKVDILNQQAWEKFQKGEYTGFSGAFGRKAITSNVDKDFKKAIEIIVEKNSYSAEQLNKLKSSFPGENRITINEVMRFSEIPSQIININVYLSVQYLLQTIQNHPMESGVVTVGGMVLNSAIDAVVKDIYGFIKNGAKTLFSGKFIPKVVVKNTTLNKDLQIRIEGKSASEMQDAVKLFNETYSKLIKDNKTKIKKAKRILFERKDGKWCIKLDL